ncbi:DUF397 domain-containing protein [Streptomyces sp. PTM05]|uniref:DUF397 domain-containing protein n=1 Tax=Streptantibioticus parmotrematis TaxID=2873249 RepID=A0ABS7QNP9_9ACTN|nr:DUF397 domain-containing protein [Streptantibioticus parmotrematis]MBY8884798.1 DUF397 domain-containing protein [Streptantibioticus parmotrematis]
MQSVHNGVAAGSLVGARWVKASASDGRDDCVELADLGENVAMRNSRDPLGPALIFTRSELAAFVAGSKDGEFDSMTV